MNADYAQGSLLKLQRLNLLIVRTSNEIDAQRTRVQHLEKSGRCSATARQLLNLLNDSLEWLKAVRRLVVEDCSSHC